MPSGSIESRQGALQARVAELHAEEESLKLIGTITRTALALLKGKVIDQVVQPETASDGSLRIRAYTMDEDAYSGNFGGEALTGMVLLEEKYLVVEEFYPNGRERKTYITTVDLDEGTVTQKIETNDNVGTQSLDIALPLQGNEKVKELGILNARIAKYASMDSSDIKPELARLRTPYEFYTEQLR